MMILFYIYIFILGLLIGSFLNVCIYRIPKEESIINPPSHCTNCGARLTPLDLVPVFSFLVLRGKCRYCGIKISKRYPAIELLTALTFVVLFNKYSLSIDFLAAAFLISILITVFFIDLEHKIIPDGLVITGLVGGLLLIVYNLFKPVQIFGDRAWWTPLAGILPGSGFLFLVALIGIIIYKTDDAMGMGDVKIFAPIGIFLGWKMTIVALLLSIFLGGISSLILLCTGVKERKSTIPFGPFIVVGTFITLMWGWDIVSWYISRL
jgi:leader peptidase (prepilin peptidase) / N-methyltransferase